MKLLPLRDSRHHLLAVVRMGSLIVTSMFVGSALTMYVHGQDIAPLLQTIPERMARQETENVLLNSQVARLESDVKHAESEIATMEGLGIGLGAALGFLQLIQMVLGRKTS
jgi:hypothetical protein